MKLYVKAFSTYRDDCSKLNIKNELKTKYKLDTRRQDDFVHLSVYGAQLLSDKVDINSSDELYITSGVGNVGILQKINNYVYEKNEFIKLIDFINMLGNTTSYYVATSLGLKDKNIFQISNKFTFINTLISIYASLYISKNDAILGSVDLCTNPNEVIKRVLGVNENTKVTSSVNYQKLSLSCVDAIAEIEFDSKIYSFEEVKKLLETANVEVVSSPRCKKLDTLKDNEFFETLASFYINKAIQMQKNLLYVDCSDDYYKIINITLL